MLLRHGLVFVGLLSTAFIARGTPLFSDDFEGGLGQWTAVPSSGLVWIWETDASAPGINAPHTGHHFADPGCSGAGCMDSSTGLFLYHDIVGTVPGQSYTLTFWLDLGPCKLSFQTSCPTGSLAEQFQAWFGDPTAVPGAGHGTLGAPVFDTGLFNNTTLLDPGWSLQTIQVTATSTTTRLEFIGRDDPLRIGLDDISVDPVVPEPSTMLLFGIGLVSLAAIARRLNLAPATK